MHPSIDLQLILQLLAAVLIVLTMPDNDEQTQPEKASMTKSRKQFQLADGNTYVELAGMAVEVDRFRNFKTAF